MSVSETIKLILVALFACAVLLFGQTVMDWRAGSIQNEERGRSMKAASGIISDGGASSQAKQEAEVGVAGARNEFEQKAQEDSRREPETANRDTRSVPTSRLRAFEERRLKRERAVEARLRRAGIEREGGPGPKDPPKR